MRVDTLEPISSIIPRVLEAITGTGQPARQPVKQLPAATVRRNRRLSPPPPRFPPPPPGPRKMCARS
ncbi:MAG: hypothetical protein M0Z41_13665 [Peptococcaceae bacterium]|jgi:hypothetical protein|nr:hypothetical protein [Peptococcaceae bacterium]